MFYPAWKKWARKFLTSFLSDRVPFRVKKCLGWMSRVQIQKIIPPHRKWHLIPLTKRIGSLIYWKTVMGAVVIKLVGNWNLNWRGTCSSPSHKRYCCCCFFLFLLFFFFYDQHLPHGGCTFSPCIENVCQSTPPVQKHGHYWKTLIWSSVCEGLVTSFVHNPACLSLTARICTPAPPLL